MLHHISSHDITSHLITLHLITPHYISSHLITSHLITSHLITLHHTTSHHISSHHITSHHIVSSLITSHRITSLILHRAYIFHLSFFYCITPHHNSSRLITYVRTYYIPLHPIPLGGGVRRKKSIHSPAERDDIVDLRNKRIDMVSTKNWYRVRYFLFLSNDHPHHSSIYFSIFYVIVSLFICFLFYFIFFVFRLCSYHLLINFWYEYLRSRLP